MEGCAGTCIMEGRLQGLEKRLDEQAKQYTDSQVKFEGRMAHIESSVDKLLQGQNDMSAMLTTVLKGRQEDELEKARNSNKAAASKWNSLSSEAKSIIKSVFLLIVGAAITAFVAWAANR